MISYKLKNKKLPTIHYSLFTKNGLTLIELLVPTAILAILVFTVGYVFVVGLNLWNEGYARSDIRGDISQGMELISKNLRQAKSIDILTESSITFTADLGSGDDTYRVYLYNSADPEPNPPYTQSSYELRWAKGTVTYGSGAILARDIAPPTNTPFTQSGNYITIDLTVTRADETLRIR